MTENFIEKELNEAWDPEEVAKQDAEFAWETGHPMDPDEWEYADKKNIMTEYDFTEEQAETYKNFYWDYYYICMAGDPYNDDDDLDENLTETKATGAKGRYQVEVFDEGDWHKLNSWSTIEKATKAGKAAVEAVYQDYRIIDKETNDEVELDEALNEESEGDLPFTKKQIYDELKRETNNWEVKEDTFRYFYESEKDFAMEILSKHYECEYRSTDKDGWHVIRFWKQNLKESLEEGIFDKKKIGLFNKHNGEGPRHAILDPKKEDEFIRKIKDITPQNWEVCEYTEKNGKVVKGKPVDKYNQIMLDHEKEIKDKLADIKSKKEQQAKEAQQKEKEELKKQPHWTRDPKTGAKIYRSLVDEEDIIDAQCNEDLHPTINTLEVFTLKQLAREINSQTTKENIECMIAAKNGYEIVIQAADPANINKIDDLVKKAAEKFDLFPDIDERKYPSGLIHGYKFKAVEKIAMREDYKAKETSQEIANQIAEKAKEELNLSDYEAETLEHDINNLRAYEWINSFEELPETSEARKMFFEYCVEQEKDEFTPYTVVAFELNNSTNRMNKRLVAKKDSYEEAEKLAKTVAERISDVQGKNYVNILDNENEICDTISGPYNADINPSIDDLIEHVAVDSYDQLDEKDIEPVIEVKPVDKSVNEEINEGIFNKFKKKDKPVERNELDKRYGLYNRAGRMVYGPYDNEVLAELELTDMTKFSDARYNELIVRELEEDDYKKYVTEAATDKESKKFEVGSEKVFSEDSEEWAQLQKAADKLTELSVRNVRYFVGNTYLDFGSGWQWTTILAKKPNEVEYQVLSPLAWRNIMNAHTEEELDSAIDSLRSDEYFSDKVKEPTVESTERDIFEYLNSIEE